MSYKPKTTKIPCENQRQVNRSLKVTERSCSYTKDDSNHVKNRSCSTGTITNISTVTKPKKTTKSACLVSGKYNRATPKLSRCQACGDSAKNTPEKKKSNVFINTNGVKNTGVQHHFTNKNFRQSSASMYAEGLRVTNLNTIKESEENIQERASSGASSEDEDKISDIQELKQFRRQNYFECHSAAAKLETLEGHSCFYRFYLNDRLFPVPVSADYNNVVRCTECHLPLEGYENLNGTIQAKVKINGTVQDMMLMLPAKKSLIIQERRKGKVERREEEPLYFGIVRLGQDGDSLFRRNYPSDSLALKYQKGYLDLRSRRKYEYERVEDEEVIVI